MLGASQLRGEPSQSRHETSRAGTQDGGGGVQISRQPGTPSSQTLAMFGGVHVPPAGNGVHAGGGPPQHGRTQISSGAQVCEPHSTGSAPAGISGEQPPEPPPPEEPELPPVVPPAAPPTPPVVPPVPPVAA
jgi:hypothetical protein